jgi:hypothetical protein
LILTRDPAEDGGPGDAALHGGAAEPEIGTAGLMVE